MTNVSIVRCKDYEQSNVDTAVQKALSLIGNLQDIIKPGNKVLLKVNLLDGTEPSKAVTTHPAIVKSIIELVKKVGGIPIIADSPGSFSANKNNKAIIKSGMKEIADAAGIEALQFESVNNSFVKINVPNAVHLKTMYVARLALEADVIISIPKLKTHLNTLYTGAVKNMFGVIAPKTRDIAHKLGSYKKFSNSIIDIYSAVKPHLNIMDAVIGMEGEGPHNGSPKFAGLVLASYDAVALDTVASKIIGFNPADIYTNSIADKRGLGKGDLSKIRILGETIKDVSVNFKKSAITISNIPPMLMGIYNTVRRIEPLVINDKCIKCGVCAESCPAEAIKLSPYPIINKNLCISCFCCNEMCPENAITTKKSWLLRLYGKLKGKKK
ncbi:MAG: DUF362 domain-containing protein [bacterium]|nr:DUF362 domain-containing protein [bacterium]